MEATSIGFILFSGNCNATYHQYKFLSFKKKNAIVMLVMSQVITDSSMAIYVDQEINSFRNCNYI